MVLSEYHEPSGISGKSDVLLLEHELFEVTYYNNFHPINGCTVRDAHEFTTNYYDWDGLIPKYWKNIYLKEK